MFNFSATMDNSKGKLPFKHAKYQLVRITGFGKNKSRRLVAEKFVPGLKHLKSYRIKILKFCSLNTMGISSNSKGLLTKQAEKMMEI